MPAKPPRVAIVQRVEKLEHEVRRLQKAVAGRSAVARKKKHRATYATVRRDFIEEMKRAGQIDYLEFWRRTGYPYELVEQVLAELEDRGAIECVD